MGSENRLLSAWSFHHGPDLNHMVLDLNHIEHPWDLPDKVWSMNTQQLTWLQGSAANVWVPVTTENLRRCPCLSGSELVWQHKGDLHNIRQVVFMLADWCIWLSALLFPSAGKSPTAQDVKLVGWRARMHTVINDILSSVTIPNPWVSFPVFNTFPHTKYRIYIFQRNDLHTADGYDQHWPLGKSDKSSVPDTSKCCVFIIIPQLAPVH